MSAATNPDAASSGHRRDSLLADLAAAAVVTVALFVGQLIVGPARDGVRQAVHDAKRPETLDEVDAALHRVRQLLKDRPPSWAAGLHAEINDLLTQREALTR